MVRLPITPALILLIPLAARAQLLMLPAPAADPPRPRYGGYGSLALNLHTSDFQELRDCPDCVRHFTGGAGIGFVAGLLYEEPITTAFSAGLRLGYSSDGATLSTVEKTRVMVDGRETEGTFEHGIRADLTAIGIEPLVGYRPRPSLILYAGGRFGFRMTRRFEQRKTLLTPEDGGAFDDGSRARVVYSGVIPDARRLTGSALLGIAMEMPLNAGGTLLLAPELFLSIGVTSVRSDTAWRTSALRFGLALKLVPDRADEPVALAPSALPPPLVSMVVTGVDTGGVERQVPRLVVEEFASVNTRPLLNYLFFDEGSAEIPGRYLPARPHADSTFTIASLHDLPTLAVYHRLLDIVGLRMREHAGATITIVGCAAGAGAELGDTTLARLRAEGVEGYLRDVWGIAPGRMRIVARDIPARPSRLDDPDGLAENRRAEIESDDPAILAPVVTNDTLRLADPAVVRFAPVVRGASPASWRLTVVGRERVLKEAEGRGSAPRVIEWRPSDELGNIPRASGLITYVLDVQDSAGRAIAASGLIPVDLVSIDRKRSEGRADREIDRYGLILFDFDRSDLSDANRLLASGIRAWIAPGARVTIEGSTDRSGEEEHNRRLSASRAAAVARALGLERATVRGLGESSAHDNDLPEGRFYCRTVTIVAESPADR